MSATTEDNTRAASLDASGNPKVKWPRRGSAPADPFDNEKEDHKDSQRSSESTPVHRTLSEQPPRLDNNNSNHESQSGAIIGGKYAQDESSYQDLAKGRSVRKIDPDIPLTMTEGTENKGKSFTLLYFNDTDTEDPFNWPRAKKNFISVLLCLMTLFIGLATTAYSSGITRMVNEFGVSHELGQLGLFCFNMTCALAPLLLAPFCELVGRRYIYAGSFLCFCIMFIGLALGKNIATILVCRTLLGLFGCVGTILVGGTFADMYTTEDRAVPIASFSYVAILGTVGAPIYAGFIDATLGWRWIEAIQGFANIPLLIVILLCLKETRGDVVLQKRAKMIKKATGEDRYVSPIDLDAQNIGELLHNASVKAVKLLVTEIVVFAFGLWIAFAWFLTFLFLSVIPITFQEKRGWSEGVGGLPYISLVVGVTLAYIANFAQIRYYKKLVHDPNVQVVVPEQRLWGAMFGGPFLAIGLFIYSFTQYGYLTWVGPTIALAPISFGIFFIFEATYSYTSDCYGASSSSAIAAQGLMRNSLGAVSPLFASQFFHNVGSQYAGLILALVATVLSFIPFVFYKYGHVLREKSSQANCPEKDIQRAKPGFTRRSSVWF